MPEVLERDIIPAEFVGLARRFVTANSPLTDIDRVMAAIRIRAENRLRTGGKGGFRGSPFVETERLWKTLPPTGQLLLEVKRTKVDLTIRDVRLCAEKVANSAWEEGSSEVALTICECVLHLDSRRVERSTTRTAAIAAHALGRYYQRSLPNDDETLLAALRVIAAEAQGLAQAAPANNAPIKVVSQTGEWRGVATLYERAAGEARTPIAALRTFV